MAATATIAAGFQLSTSGRAASLTAIGETLSTLCSVRSISPATPSGLAATSGVPSNSQKLPAGKTESHSGQRFIDELLAAPIMPYFNNARVRYPEESDLE